MGCAIVVEFLVDFGGHTRVVDQRLASAHALRLDLVCKVSKDFLT
jgi:hypothetical protein